MSGDRYIVFAGDCRWRVACVRDGAVEVRPVGAGAEASLDARADSVGDVLAELGHAGQPVMLAIASSWCLCATISTDDLPRAGRHEAMTFRLEEHLPISAEDVVTDYMRTGPDEALGVCCERGKIEALVAALAARGAAVRHVCPESLLAAAHASETCGQADCVLVGRGADEQDRHAGTDFIELRGGKCASWLWLADDESAAGEHVAALAEATRDRPRVAVVGCGEALVDLGGAAEIVGPCQVGPDEAAALRAGRILDEAATPWIDLRCGPMASGGADLAYRKPLTALAAAAAVLLLCVCGAFLWRGRQYAATAGQYDSQQSAVFRQAMPAQRVPAAGVMARLQSERRRLEILSGRPAGGGEVLAGAQGSALKQLRDVLAGLPGDLRYRIVQLSILPDLIRVDGEARSYADADRLAAALRQSGAYDVDPGKMEAIKDGGVSFMFTARPHRETGAAKESH